MKTVGIIGGLGPETTSEFYLDLVFSCAKNDKTSRPPILMKMRLLKTELNISLRTNFNKPEWVNLFSTLFLDN